MSADMTIRVGRQQPTQVVPIDPLHFHHMDPTVADDVLHVDEVVLLDAGHSRGDRGQSGHLVGVVVLGREVIGCKDLQGHRDREPVHSTTFAQVHHTLATDPQALQERA